MKTGYIGHNQYRYRYFYSPLGYTKFLLDVFIHPNFINAVEHNVVGKPSEEEMHRFALDEIKRLEAII